MSSEAGHSAGPGLNRAIEKLMIAASELELEAGYANGEYYSDWHVRASPALLHALANLVRAYDPAFELLAKRCEKLGDPFCAEILSDDPIFGTISLCDEPVEQEGRPCSAHSVARAAELGRCTFRKSSEPSEMQRSCAAGPAPGDDRCERHSRYCRAIKRNGEICNEPDCSVPKHRKVLQGEK
ncbi:hypothetical protein [Streptomyces sp. bgisy126]|uniref:hypothetical protein n=1 Tax=unclassified Streptomyces TaxID=2593676 RepID=UPI003EBA42F7